MELWSRAVRLSEFWLSEPGPGRARKPLDESDAREGVRQDEHCLVPGGLVDSADIVQGGLL